MYKSVLRFTREREYVQDRSTKNIDMKQGYYIQVNAAHQIRTYLLHNPCPNAQKRDITNPSEITSSAKKTPPVENERSTQTTIDPGNISR
jgi:hypothetical protein